MWCQLHSKFTGNARCLASFGFTTNLAARIGWGPDGVHVRVTEQMAKIRAACAKMYYQIGVFGRPPNGEAGVGGGGDRPAGL